MFQVFSGPPTSITQTILEATDLANRRNPKTLHIFVVIVQGFAWGTKETKPPFETASGECLGDLGKAIAIGTKSQHTTFIVGN